MKGTTYYETIEFLKSLPRWLFVKITTKRGIIGWGGTGGGRKSRYSTACVMELQQYLIGRSASKY